MAIDVLRNTPVERFLDAMAGNLDGPAAEDVSLKVNLVLTDPAESHVLWIRNAVLHHRKGPPAGDADATLTVTKDLFVRILAGSAGAREVLLGDQARTSGSRVALVRFFRLFPKPDGRFPIVTR